MIGARKAKVVLSDTGPLYALATASDQYHEQARSELAHFLSEDVKLALSYSTLLETQTLLLRKMSLPFTRSFLDTLMQASYLLNPSAQDYGAAYALLAPYTDQQITWADATLAVMSQQLGVPVWTYDRDFDILGIQVWRPLDTL